MWGLGVGLSPDFGNANCSADLTGTWRKMESVIENVIGRVPYESRALNFIYMLIFCDGTHCLVSAVGKELVEKTLVLTIRVTATVA